MLVLQIMVVLASCTVPVSGIRKRITSVLLKKLVEKNHQKTNRPRVVHPDFWGCFRVSGVSEETLHRVLECKSLIQALKAFRSALIFRTLLSFGKAAESTHIMIV